MDGGNGTLTINGLDNSKTYDFYAYSQGNHTNPAIGLSWWNVYHWRHVALGQPDPPRKPQHIRRGRELREILRRITYFLRNYRHDKQH